MEHGGATALESPCFGKHVASWVMGNYGSPYPLSTSKLSTIQVRVFQYRSMGGQCDQCGTLAATGW